MLALRKASRATGRHLACLLAVLLGLTACAPGNHLGSGEVADAWRSVSLHSVDSRPEEPAVNAQIAACWRAPEVDSTEDHVARLLLEVGPDRQVRQVMVEDRERFDRDPEFRALAESAIAAVDRCGALDLPPERHDEWQEMVLTFRFEGEIPQPDG